MRSNFATGNLARRSRPVIAAALLTAPLVLAGCAGGDKGGDADGYPDDTIEVVVPFSSGGPTDTVTRIMAESMGKDLGEQMIVKNVEGAGGTVGAGEVASAKPDGYTALVHHIGMSTAPALYDNLNFDPVKDFEPVGLISDVPMTIVSRKGLGPKNLEELVEYIKKNGKNVKLAHAGVGSASNLCGLLLEDKLDVDVKEVPYDGAAPAMTDLLAGEVDVLCDQTTNTSGQIKGKKVDAYAVTTPERVDSLPDLPTAAEAGLDDFDLSVWHALYLPAGTPKKVVDTLQKSLAKALADQSVVDKFADLGTAPVPADDATPDAVTQRLKEQIDLWADVLAGQKS